MAPTAGFKDPVQARAAPCGNSQARNLVGITGYQQKQAGIELDARNLAVPELLYRYSKKLRNLK